MSLILCLFITFIDFEFEIGFDFDLVDLKASLNVEVEMTLEVDYNIALKLLEKSKTYFDSNTDVCGIGKNWNLLYRILLLVAEIFLDHIVLD